MVNIGIDFGSTNTLIARYDRNEGAPVIIQKQGLDHQFWIPSYVAYDKRNDVYEYGYAAKARVGYNDYKVYKAFKMLIRESDKAVLSEWNYDEKNTPEKIAKMFIEYCLNLVLDSTKEKKIGTLTIGIPEIWRQPSINSGKSSLRILREICEGLGLAQSVELVTEPEAASAYFAYRFFKDKNRIFNGHVLIVDFGGGTLDITVSSVEPGRMSDSDEIVHDMSIRTADRTGSGENSTDTLGKTAKVGNAGLLYLESVVDLALKEVDIDPIKAKRSNARQYFKLVEEFENALIINQSRIERELKPYANDIYDEDSLVALDDETFLEGFYRGEDVRFTYGMLVRVYREKIYTNFEIQMRIIIEKMEKLDIHYEYGNNDSFQVALVGGFGNFYLVQQQLKMILNINQLGDIITGANECEKAIVNGTALYSDKIVGHIQTAPYSLGIRLYDPKGNKYDCYAFQYRDKIDPDKYYFIEYNGRKVRFHTKTASIEHFLRKEKYDQDEKPFLLKLKEKYIKALSEIQRAKSDRIAIGFKVDRNDVLTVYSFEVDANGKVNYESSNDIVLGDWNNMFDPVADVD